MRKTLLSAAMLAALFCSCGNGSKSVNLAGEWNIVSVEGQQVNADKKPFLGFDMKEGRLYGNAGCNNIMASVSVDSVKGSIELSEVSATRKMCMDMELENQVLAALGKVVGYQTSVEGVELTDANGKVVFGLEKAEMVKASKLVAAMSVENLAGEWLISSVNGKKVEIVEKTPFIAFNVAEKTVHGTAGCNIFNGGYTQEEGKPVSLQFGNLATTMMAGPGMEQEGVILAAMGNVRGFSKKAEGTVALVDENQNEVVVLTKNTGKSLAE